MKTLMLSTAFVLLAVLFLFTKPSPLYAFLHHRGEVVVERISGDRALPKHFATGDFDGDGLRDSVWFNTPKTGDDSGHTIIRFTHGLPRFRISGCSIGLSHLSVAANYNNSKHDLLFFVPAWQNSCQSNAFLYQYFQNKWNLIDSVAVYRCNPDQSVDVNDSSYTIRYHTAEYSDAAFKSGVLHHEN